MEKGIINFLSKYLTLTNEDVQIIADLDLIQTFKKGTLLLKEGCLQLK